MTINRVVISSAHSKFVSGAVSILNEVTESRRVVPRVAHYLERIGIKADVFNDDTSRSQATNLAVIVAHHNNQVRDVDCSIHFNAHLRTSQPRGVEVLHRTQGALAARVTTDIAKASGLVNRGAKMRTDLAFLNGCRKPAILVEVCFVDSEADAKLYQSHFEAICKAIADGIAGRSTVNPPKPPGTTHPPTIRRGSKGEMVREAQQLLNEHPTHLKRLLVDGDFGTRTDERVREFQRANNLLSDGVIGPLTWGRLKP